MSRKGPRVAVVCSVLCVLALASGCAEMQKQFVDPFTSNSRPKNPEPAFEWDATFSSPGTSLTIEEKQRAPMQSGTMLQYGITATGFDAGEQVDLWWKRGTTYEKLPAAVSEDGTILIGGTDVLGVAGLPKGQAVDLALASGEKRAQAKVIPFPITASKGRLWISAEVITESGLLFLITMGGFEPIELVEVTSDFKSESHTNSMEASMTGEISFPVMFGKGDRGMAAIFANGTSGSVSLQYEVGEDALRAQ